MYDALKNLFKKAENMANETNKENSQLNSVLEFLCKKNIGQWTKQSDIENRFKDEIAPFTVDCTLQRLNKEGMVEYSRNMGEFKASGPGRALMVSGGYK